MAVLAGAAILIGGGILVLNKNLQTGDSELALSDDAVKPWLEVVAPAVFELDEETQKVQLRELKTGDELSEGMAIGVEKAGLANIHFGDGSVARLDSGTKIILEEGKYFQDKGSLVVSINLVWGRVWSKIVGLTTPESAWDVKTSNAVATVRGTAFGVEYVEEGKSNVVGYENKVAVKMIDPDTKEVMKGVEMVVEPKKFLEVKKEAIREMKDHLARGEVKSGVASVSTEAGKTIMEVKEAPAEVLKKDWVRRGIEEDEKLNKRMEVLKEKIRNEKEFRKELRKEVREEFLNVIKEKEEVLEQRREELKTEKKSEAPDPETSERFQSEAKSTGEAAVKEAVDPEIRQIQPAVIPRSLKVVSKKSLDTVPEGELLSLRAVVVFSNGSEQDVTDAASWQVVGPIGVMERPGLFAARLHPSVSELGSASGAVAVTWKDDKTGAALLGQTPIFKVEMLIDTNFDPTRG